MAAMLVSHGVTLGSLQSFLCVGGLYELFEEIM